MAKIFLISPFGKPFDAYFKDILQPALSAQGHQLSRGDSIFTSGVIINDIFKSIISSDIIIADVTDSNANVFYELGVAHSHQKPVIIITQSIEKVPFDIFHLRCIEYSPGTRKWVHKLVASLLGKIDEIISRDDWLSVTSDFALGGVYLKNFSEIISFAEQMILNAKNYFFVTRLCPNEAILQHEKRYFELTDKRIRGSGPDGALPN